MIKTSLGLKVEVDKINLFFDKYEVQYVPKLQTMYATSKQR